jgi:hypothetical protein
MHNKTSSAATLRIISHNTNRSTDTRNTLLNTAGKTTDLILVQEANIKDIRYATTHPDFLLLLPPHGARPVNRTAAYISRLNPHLRVTPRPDICSDPDLQVLEVQTELIPKLYLLNIYNEYDRITKLHTMPRALMPLSLPNRCIITVDLNAHHTLWNCRARHSTRADELAALIENEGWHLINALDIATYHYRNGTGSSVLDLTIASPAVAREVTNWAMDDENPIGSDHEVIRFQITSLHPDAEFSTGNPKLNRRKTNWETFVTTLQTLTDTTSTRWTPLSQNPTPENLDEWANILRDSIQAAAEVSTHPLNPKP